MWVGSAGRTSKSFKESLENRDEIQLANLTEFLYHFFLSRNLFVEFLQQKLPFHVYFARKFG